MAKVTDRKYYKKLFSSYDDVVDTKTFCIMLGGIGINTTLKLINNGHLKAIHYLNQRYLIPKEWVIDFVTGPYYDSIKNTLKAQI